MEALKSRIRHVPDFPKPGILFYDVTTLLRDPQGFKLAIDSLAAPFTGKPIDVVVGIESRGFILGGAVADRIGAVFLELLPHALDIQPAAYWSATLFADEPGFALIVNMVVVSGSDAPIAVFDANASGGLYLLWAVRGGSPGPDSY